MEREWEEIMEKRIAKLERDVFGTVNDDIDYPKITDSLRNIQGMIQDATKGKQKILNVLKRAEEINDMLDSEYTDKISLSNQAKRQLVLIEEPRIKEQVNQMKIINEASKSLDSEHIKRVPALQSRLQELQALHLSQEEQHENISKEFLDCVLRYNQIISLLSQQMIDWDNTISSLESVKTTR